MARLDNKPVVITGLGIVAPGAIGIKQFWEKCIEGQSGVSNIDTFNTDQFDAKIAGIVKEFDPTKYGVTEEQINTFDRYVLFALVAAQEAMKQSGLTEYNMDPTRIGACIATAIGGTKYMEEEFLRLTNNCHEELNPELVSPNIFAGASFHMASAEVAKQYNIQGPIQTITTGCTAGLDAVGQALELIRTGKADVVITGASEAPITPIAMAAFDIIGALTSDRNDNPDKASRPYDKTRSGFVLGEGCGLFILESKEHAQKRNAKILAEVKGYGSTCNAYHMTDLSPEGDDLARAIKLSLEDAGLCPDKIDCINSHGSSTPQNDVNETNAIKKALGDHAYKISISSLKSIMGHALAAANAIELVAGVLSIVEQKVYPTINYKVPDPNCDLNYVPNQAKPLKIDYLLKDASGFSGIHSSLILARNISD